MGFVAPLLMATAGVAGAIGNRRAAQEQKIAQAQQTRAAFQQAYAEQVAQRQQQSQQADRLNRAALQQQLRTRAERSRALTAAGESGVSGNSVDALLRDFDLNQSLYNESLDAQRRADSTLSTLNMRNIERTRNANILGINRPVHSGIALPLIQGAVGAWDSWDRWNTTKQQGLKLDPTKGMRWHVYKPTQQ